MQNTLTKPKMLRPGDTVGIIAPAYSITPDRLEGAIATLENLGYRVKLSKNLYSTTNDYAGSVAERADDFNTMIADDEVKALIFGGGEVCNEILPHIDYDAVRANPKILCSYSDSTTILNAVTSRAGVVTFYGASPRTLRGDEPYNLRSFASRLASLDTAYEKATDWRVICPGKCRGRLTGGYLANYAALFATPYFAQPQDNPLMLFIEDHRMFSEPAAVSKHFANLEMYGAFERVGGLIFGHYSDEEYPVIDDILRRIGERHGIPVVRCDDFGHGTYNSILPIGIGCALDTKADSFELLESGTVE